MDSQQYGNPGKECDLVMKGGVASGIVYPQAILTLAEKYRFRSIGGTSAGAIAAALAAAAEYGREKGGFDALEQVRKCMIQEDAIFKLFQPAPSTRPLWDTIWKTVGEPKPEKPQGTAKKKSITLGTVVRKLPRLFFLVLPRTVTLWFCLGVVLGLLVGALGGIAFGLLLALLIAAIQWSSATNGSTVFDFANHFLSLAKPLGIAGAIIGLLFGICMGGLLGAGLKLLLVIWKKVPANGFGICTGKTIPGNRSGLTDWLHEKINICAGRTAQDPPLTFRDLKGKQHEGPSVSIDLRAVTTNLSQGRPYIFPLTEERFICQRDIMRKLFPENVCCYMEQLPVSDLDLKLPDGYYYLPAGDDLPIVVAARLSLSLPFVLTAVPLFTIEEDAHARARAEASTVTCKDLQKNWFTDGGISSNFPIHLFDSWLPTRPTFGIRLTALTRDTADPMSKGIKRSRLSAKLGGVRTAAAQSPEQTHSRYNPNPAAQVYLPPAHAAVPENWTCIARIPAFIAAIFNTARNYHDNTQSALASYRERIAQVRLSPDEGGMNLRMSKEILKGMNDLGCDAAKEFVAFYGDPDNPAPDAGYRFHEHRWVRLRMLAAQLERQFNRTETSFTNLYRVKYPGAPLPETGIAPFIEQEYAALLNDELRYIGTDASWYASKGRVWCDEAQGRLAELFALMDGWNTADIPDAPDGWPPFFDDTSAPKPSGTLRVTPEL